MRDGGADLGWDDDWNDWEASHNGAPALGRYLGLIAPLVGVMSLSSYLVLLMWMPTFMYSRNPTAHRMINAINRTPFHPSIAIYAIRVKEDAVSTIIESRSVCQCYLYIFSSMKYSN